MLLSCTSAMAVAVADVHSIVGGHLQSRSGEQAEVKAYEPKLSRLGGMSDP